ncbi:hypothetical protein FRC03_011958 [Tulasnella sp. 419]|nr:hypothetical protein FRC03_011958 [Tulasnella sp. 419]
MKEDQKALQAMAGIDSIKYAGALGHNYYVNDIGQIISQEMANPRVRPHLHFYPEDAGNSLSEAWQGARWLHTMDDSLLTPMVRVTDTGGSHQDYYIHEPTLLMSGQACIPHRWFIRDKKYFAKAWELQNSGNGNDAKWIIREDRPIEVSASDLQFSLPFFEAFAESEGLPSPHLIAKTIRLDGSSIQAERTCYTNPWRTKAHGRRVLSFPIWLYCDDTSGNVSKKWNKHNSFLFTAAGLPRKHVQREYNVHFLSTSNIAPPLEMLDGIVEQLRKYQDEGIGCWDMHLGEEVLVFIVVLALLGDNPMQSELACHMGLAAKLFCRVCWVSSRTNADKDEEEESEDNGSDAQSVGSLGSAAGSARSGNSVVRTLKRRKAVETRESMVDRVYRFMQKGDPRNKYQSQKLLGNIFTTAAQTGGKTEATKLKTKYGLKDRFQEFFIEKLYKSIKGKNGRAASMAMTAELSKLPKNHSSPVWRIKGLDPHTDTPVEILHVILLGILKYFWRDAVARVSDQHKPTLIARLSSLNTSGLGIPTIGGKTLVQYCRSLTGRDFRVISQVAPFVLHDLDLPMECLKAWMALTSLVPLIWQPEIPDVVQHLSAIKSGIDHLLNCTARWTPRWFNKPKFHILLHLVDHIRDFGPASLFATEAFESFNAIIRMKSVHSNRQAPSRDIARAFAQVNRLRHIISGGFFAVKEDRAFDVSLAEYKFQIPDPASEGGQETSYTTYVYRQYGVGPKNIARDSIVSHYIGFYSTDPSRTVGRCILDTQKARSWRKTLTGGKCDFPSVPEKAQLQNLRFNTAKSVELLNGDVCRPGDWVLVADASISGTGQRVATIWEIIQTVGSPLSLQGRPDFVSVRVADITGVSSFHYMPTLCLTDQIKIVGLQDINCSANVQHNCLECRCQTDKFVPVREEREESTRTRMSVNHRTPRGNSNRISEWILNTAKMRDAIYIQRFRQTAPAIERQRAIEEGVAREIFEEKATRQQPHRNPGPSIQRDVLAHSQTSHMSHSLNQPRRLTQIQSQKIH